MILQIGGITVYERQAIANALQINPTSPITRKPLRPEELIEAPAVKQQIIHRLQQYQEGLQHFLAEHASAPAAD